MRSATEHSVRFAIGVLSTPEQPFQRRDTEKVLPLFDGGAQVFLANGFRSLLSSSSLHSDCSRWCWASFIGCLLSVTSRTNVEYGRSVLSAGRAGFAAHAMGHGSFAF